MGPAGAGKTTVGRALAAALGWRFHDADDYHPPANVARMHAGLPLTDDERAPWLAALAAVVARHVASGSGAVLACSALRRAYREALLPPEAPPGAVRLVFLRATPTLLAARLAHRPRHFFPESLLASQLTTLEEPAASERVPALTVDASEPVDALVTRIRRALGV